ncbi:MAG: hypothetical protein DI630_16880 [Gordonia sp. (in: high G+C Gram-positive bacteria)]|nr:MAG: hypothetical protein DI630_16880 [Gordonia sp. (in: high G+C Gram-positive bacteria)]
MARHFRAQQRCSCPAFWLPGCSRFRRGRSARRRLGAGRRSRRTARGRGLPRRLLRRRLLGGGFLRGALLRRSPCRSIGPLLRGLGVSRVHRLPGSEAGGPMLFGFFETVQCLE